MDLVIGLAIPFLGTTLGAATVFLMKDKMSIKIRGTAHFTGICRDMKCLPPERTGYRGEISAMY